MKITNTSAMAHIVAHKSFTHKELKGIARQAGVKPGYFKSDTIRNLLTANKLTVTVQATA